MHELKYYVYTNKDRIATAVHNSKNKLDRTLLTDALNV